MHPYRAAAIATLTGLGAGLLTMTLHPTGQDVVRDAASGGTNLLVTAVHALAILAQPLVVCGMIGLSALLGITRPLVIGGLVFFSMNSVAVLIEAVASGFLAPSVLRGFAEAEPAGQAVMLANLRYTGQLNRSFASVQVLLAAVAILCWSLAARTNAPLRGSVYAGGVAAAVLLIVGRLSGILGLDVHGYGIIVGIQALWLATVAWQLWKAGEVPGRA